MAWERLSLRPRSCGAGFCKQQGSGDTPAANCEGCAGSYEESWGSGILSLHILHVSSPPALGGKVVASTARVDLL